MKGKYDSIISWPFRGVVEVTLRRWIEVWGVSTIFNYSDAGDLGAQVVEGTMAWDITISKTC